MKRMVSLALIALTLTSCMLRTHKADIIQGNVISDADVRKLHVGMSESEVKNMMGNPVLINVFTPNNVTYLYTYQEGYGKMKKKSVTLAVKNGRVTDIQVLPYQ